MAGAISMAGGGSLGASLKGGIGQAFSAGMGQSPFLKAMNAMTGSSPATFSNGSIDPLFDLADTGGEMGDTGPQTANAIAGQPYQDPAVSTADGRAKRSAEVKPMAPTTPAVPPVLAAPQAADGDWTPVLTGLAAKHGIDPTTLLRVVDSEGGRKGWIRSKAPGRKGGGTEPSFGPLQMLVGGGDTGFPEGMGNQFMKETGLDPRDPANGLAALDFAVGQAAKHGWGQWYGAAKAGVGKFQGIGGKGDPNAMAGIQAPQMQVAAAAGQGKPMDRVIGAVTGGLFNQGGPADAGGKPPENALQRVAAAVAKPRAPVSPAQLPEIPQGETLDLGAQEVAERQQAIAQKRMSRQGGSQNRKERIKSRTNWSA